MSESKLHALARIFESVRGILVGVIWLVVVVIILAALGKYLVFRDAGDEPAPRREERTTAAILEPIPWHEVDAALIGAFRSAHAGADSLAGAELDVWTGRLMQRVDEEFLDWYFSYWNQQLIGLESLWYASLNQVLEEQPTAAEKITENIQEQFAQRVLRPQIAQLELENITRKVVQHYIDRLQRNLDEIPEQYQIPRAEWERYLDDIAVLAADTEANREVPLSLKALYVTGAGSAVVITHQLSAIVSKMSGKVAAKSAGKAAAQMATKTGTKVAAKAGGKLLGPIIGIGIIIWDVWDHHATTVENRPILRRTLVDYMDEMKESLLYDSEFGMMTSLGRVEANVIESLRGR